MHAAPFTDHAGRMTIPPPFLLPGRARSHPTLRSPASPLTSLVVWGKGPAPGRDPGIRRRARSRSLQLPPSPPPRTSIAKPSRRAVSQSRANPDPDPSSRSQHLRDAHPPIEDHGIIGDLHTVALVALDGAIDFMCAPRFEPPRFFAALLDRSKGGVFELAPELEGARHKQLYFPETNILLTRFLSPHGVAEISDFMPLGDDERVRSVIRR